MQVEAKKWPTLSVRWDWVKDIQAQFITRWEGENRYSDSIGSIYGPGNNNSTGLELAS